MIPRGGWASLPMRGLACVAVSIALLTLFAPLGTTVSAVGWIALVPLLFALDRTTTARGAALLGYAMSLGFTGINLAFFPSALHGFAEVPLWISWIAMMICAPLLEPQFLTFALLRWVARKWRVGRFANARIALMSALAYVGTEWLWPKMFADTLGHCFFSSPYLRQGADLAGAHGLTLVILLANECALAWALRLQEGAGWKRTLAPLCSFIALFSACFGYGYWRYKSLQEKRQSITSLDGVDTGFTVGVVQANLVAYEQLARELGQYGVTRRVLDTHYAMSDALLKEGPVDLLVWPETVYPTTFGVPKSADGEALDHEISAFVSKRQVPLIFGAYDKEGNQEFNAAILLKPSVSEKPVFSTYRKSKLFPLTEWVPEILEFPWLRELLPWMGTWTPGPGPKALPFEFKGGRSLRVAPLICYESIFPGYASNAARQGAELLVMISNDSWFTGTLGPRYHLMLAAFRSIETRLPQIRATNSGISAYVDITGEIVQSTAMDQRATLKARLHRERRIPTLSVAWGDWLGPVACGGALGMFGLAGFGVRRRRPLRASASGR